MLRTDYPTYFDDTEIAIKCLQWDRSFYNVLNINQTENGVDDIEVIRKGKSTISASYQCSDFWAAKLAAFDELPSFMVYFYDVKTKDYTTLTVYMDGLSVEQVPDSDKTPGTNGLYTVSFNLVEF